MDKENFSSVFSPIHSHRDDEAETLIARAEPSIQEECLSSESEITQDHAYSLRPANSEVKLPQLCGKNFKSAVGGPKKATSLQRKQIASQSSQYSASEDYSFGILPW